MGSWPNSDIQTETDNTEYKGTYRVLHGKGHLDIQIDWTPRHGNANIHGKEATEEAYNIEETEDISSIIQNGARESCMAKAVGTKVTEKGRHLDLKLTQKKNSQSNPALALVDVLGVFTSEIGFSTPKFRRLDVL